MLLSPMPMMLLGLCSSGDNIMGSDQPAATHWAEFLSSFFFTGCFAVPILLAVTKSIELGAMATSLAGTLLLCALFGIRVYLKRKDEGDNLYGVS